MCLLETRDVTQSCSVVHFLLNYSRQLHQQRIGRTKRHQTLQTIISFISEIATQHAKEIDRIGIHRYIPQMKAAISGLEMTEQRICSQT